MEMQEIFMTEVAIGTERKRDSFFVRSGKDDNGLGAREATTIKNCLLTFFSLSCIRPCLRDPCDVSCDVKRPSFDTRSMME